jgi:heme oxygenase
MDVLHHLRAATRADHERLEQRLDVMPRLVDVRRRRHLLAGFLGIYEPFEAALVPHLGIVPEFSFDQRRKTGWLDEDLSGLGLDRAAIAALPRAPRPAIDSTAQALGIAYVLEGATLGGHVIRKQADRLGINDTGFRFYESYGAETPVMWRRFCTMLEQRCGTAEESDHAVSGACFAFRSLETWLLDHEENKEPEYVDVR